MRKRVTIIVVVIAVIAAAVFAAARLASDSPDPNQDGNAGVAPSSPSLRLGVTLADSTSDYGKAMEKSIVASASASAVTVDAKDAKRDVAAQRTIVKAFIVARVDAIAVQPVSAAGWDDTLRAAQAAKIPVIVLDTPVAADASLFASHLGSNFTRQGENVGKWLVSVAAKKFSVLELNDATEKAVAQERREGLRMALGDAKKVRKSESVDPSTPAGQKRIGSLVANAAKGDVIYAGSDAVALAVVKALKRSALVAGKGVTVVAIGGTRPAMEALAAGSLSFIAESSPFVGDQLLSLVRRLANNETVEPRVVTNENTFDSIQAREALPSRMY